MLCHGWLRHLSEVVGTRTHSATKSRDSGIYSQFTKIICCFNGQFNSLKLNFVSGENDFHIDELYQQPR